MSRRQVILSVGAAFLLLLVGVLAVHVSEARDWQPVALVVLLFVLAVANEVVTVEFGGMRLSGAFLALVLAMALLGPAPAAALGIGCAVVDAAISRRSLDRALVNVAT